MMANDTNDFDVCIFFPLDSSCVGVSRVRIEGDAVGSKDSITCLTYQINGREEESLPLNPASNLDFDIEIAYLGEGNSSIVIHTYDDSAAIDLTYTPLGRETNETYQNIEYDYEKLASAHVTIDPIIFREVLS